ncbi:hypothetical protein STFR1_140005 [Bacillus vallismortis]
MVQMVTSKTASTINILTVMRSAMTFHLPFFNNCSIGKQIVTDKGKKEVLAYDIEGIHIHINKEEDNHVRTIDSSSEQTSRQLDRHVCETT